MNEMDTPSTLDTNTMNKSNYLKGFKKILYLNKVPMIRASVIDTILSGKS